jgi:hypothetical protein
MSLFDTIYNSIAQRIVDQLQHRLVGDANQHLVTARSYRLGVQPRQLKVKGGQFDDNLTLNFTGLVVARGVSQLLGRGITFDFEGEEETEQERYVNAVLDANKQEILLHRAALAAGESGTGYLFTIPEGVIGADGQTYPRLTVIEPAFVTMDTLPEDHEFVWRYTIKYTYAGADGKERARKREITHVAPQVAADGEQTGGNTWEIVDWEAADALTAQWVEVGRQAWPYDFPPMSHWQNLPAIGTPYGESDIPDDVLRLQDRLNFSSSNLSKIVRLFAHPLRYGRQLGQTGSMTAGPENMPNFENPAAEIIQLPPVGDLAAALDVFKSQRQAFFDVTRTVDIDSLADKLGTLTNFGLRVLYQDNLAKVGTKRELMGDALEELVRRLQVMRGFEPVRARAVWPDFLPEDEIGRATYEQALVGMGVKSKQTAAEDLGLDWETEQERMDTERAGEDNIGAAILRAFDNDQNATAGLER